jgi:phage antirepressor YoqD-like protein
VTLQDRFIAAYHALHNADGLTLVSDLAKVLHIPRGEMFKRMHAAGLIFQRGPRKPWLAYDPWIKKGLFEHTIFEQTLDDGTRKDRPQLYATRKGVEKIALLFGADDDGQGRFAFGMH